MQPKPETNGAGRLPARISPRGLRARIDGGEPLQVLDVREFPEFAAGRIDSSRFLPLAQLDARCGELDPAVPIVCVCRSGQRSAQAAAKLRALGFRHVSELEGGLLAWEQDNLPLARDDRAPWALERQVRLALGIFVLAGLALSLRWPPAIAISWIIGAGMVFTSIIDWCGMALLLAKAPWNKQRAGSCGK